MILSIMNLIFLLLNCCLGCPIRESLHENESFLPTVQSRSEAWDSESVLENSKKARKESCDFSFFKTRNVVMECVFMLLLGTVGGNELTSDYLLLLADDIQLCLKYPLCMSMENHVFAMCGLSLCPYFT